MSCIRCDRKWTGTAQLHCTRCHFQFQTVEAFDAHRKAGKCLSVVDLFITGVYHAKNGTDGNVVYDLKGS